jgi:hypothetical protein
LPACHRDADAQDPHQRNHTLNRMISKTSPARPPVVSYGYDLAGRLVSVRDTIAAIAAALPPSGIPVQFTTALSYDQKAGPGLAGLGMASVPLLANTATTGYTS